MGHLNSPLTLIPARCNHGVIDWIVTIVNSLLCFSTFVSHQISLRITNVNDLIGITRLGPVAGPTIFFM